MDTDISYTNIVMHKINDIMLECKDMMMFVVTCDDKNTLLHISFTYKTAI